MSHDEKKLNASAPVAEGVDVGELARALIAAAGPGVITSVVVAAGLYDPQLSGVVIDPDEPGGGYLVERELAQGVTYIMLGVGKGVGIEPGIAPLPTEAAP